MNVTLYEFHYLVLPLAPSYRQILGYADTIWGGISSLENELSAMGLDVL
jgi:hypothetical protein